MMRRALDEKMKFLQRYSSRNDRVRKAQFHVAISCKGQEMGYAELGQPWIIWRPCYRQPAPACRHLSCGTRRAQNNHHHKHRPICSSTSMPKVPGTGETATTETAVSQATHEKQGSCQNCYCSQSAQTAKAF